MLLTSERGTNTLLFPMLMIIRMCRALNLLLFVNNLIDINLKQLKQFETDEYKV